MFKTFEEITLKEFSRIGKEEGITSEADLKHLWDNRPLDVYYLEERLREAFRIIRGKINRYNKALRRAAIHLLCNMIYRCPKCKRRVNLTIHGRCDTCDYQMFPSKVLDNRARRGALGAVV